MPQLTPGGKYVFGWSIVSSGTLMLPPEACDEYGIDDGSTLVLLSGSKTSGGLIVSTPGLLQGSVLEELASAALAAAGAVVKCGSRWTLTCELCGGCVMLSLQAMKAFSLRENDPLLVIRGSDRGFDMAQKGPLVKRASVCEGVKRFTVDPPLG